MPRPVLGFVAGFCLLFIAIATVFIPEAGIHNDEALFSVPIYQHYFEFRARAFHVDIPLMIMTYIGTLKTALYLPILRILPANAYTVRLPMVFIGSLTIFIFFVLAERISSRRAALVAVALLANDPTFLLTDTFDWGPVVLEHFLLVTGTWALVKFHQEGARNHRWLARKGRSGTLTSIKQADRALRFAGAWLEALGFLCFGLALWNKAVFLWALTGLAVASVVVLRGELGSASNRRTMLIAAAAFVIGASPFLLFNIRHRNATLDASLHLENPDWQTKFLQVRGAFDGSSLFGYVVSEDWREKPKVVASPEGRFARFVRQRFGEHRATLGYYAALACLLAVPLWWRSRAARFALIYCAVTWLMMAVTKGAGTGAHHVVLLWPFPQLFMGIVLAAIPWRGVAAIATTVLVISNLLVLNQYLFQFERDGPGPLYTDAIYSLSDALDSYAGQTIYVADWGIENPVSLLKKGRMKLDVAGGDFATDAPDAYERRHIAEMAADRHAVFAGHVDGQEVFPGSRGRVERAAASFGLHKEILQIVDDTNGRPMFEIFRWAEPQAR